MSRIAADSSVQRFRRDPVLLTTAILLAVRQLLADPVNPLRQSELYWTLQLEGFLIRSLNTALDGPDRGISSPIIVSVALLASYQVKHGSLEAYHVGRQSTNAVVPPEIWLTLYSCPDPYARLDETARCSRRLPPDRPRRPLAGAVLAMVRCQLLKIS